LRAEINKYITKVEGILDILPNPTRESFQRLFKSETDLKKGKTELEMLFNEYAADLRKEERLKTASNLENAFKSLKRYKGKLYLEDINETFLKGYQNWMIGQGNSNTTAQIYLRNLRTIYNKAIKDGFISKRHYPFLNFTIGSSVKTKNVLYPDQVKALFDYVPQTMREHRAKDMWFFCYLCNGINPKDMFYLKRSNIQQDYIIFIREKTKRTRK